MLMESWLNVQELCGSINAIDFLKAQVGRRHRGAQAGSGLRNKKIFI